MVGVLGSDVLDDLALVRLAGHDDGHSAWVGQRALLCVETQSCLALRFVRAVARVALVREDGADIAAEADALLRRAGADGDGYQRNTGHPSEAGESSPC